MAIPDKCISVNEAKALQNNWVNTREPVITAMRNGTQDTREFVFSVSELEEFLEYVKNKSENQGIDKPGVRIYFGAYNSLANSNATLFISATDGCDIDSDNNYNIEPLNTITGGFPPKIY